MGSNPITSTAARAGTPDQTGFRLFPVLPARCRWRPPRAIRSGTEAKSEAGKRSFALPAFLVDELAAHLATHRQGFTSEDLVFLGPKGGVLRRSFEARVFKRTVETAGLPQNLTFHGLRHVATTLMIANNEHPKVIQHRLGHADPAMSLGVYGHVPDDLDQDVAGRLHRLFTAAGPSTTVRLGP